MRIAVVVSFLVILGTPARGTLNRNQVERVSDLEAELGYKLSVQDKYDEWRSNGGDAVVADAGPAPEYVVKFHATAGGKLKELFALTLTVTRADGIVVQVPLAMRSKWNKENEVDVQFLIKKDVINEAVLTIRCGLPNVESSYAIRLRDYVPGNVSAPRKPSPATLTPGPYHVIRLATLADTGEQVATLDFKVFKSVDALKEHIAGFPGAEVYFQRWRGPGAEHGENKFIAATDELKTFCAQHQVILTLSAVEPVY